jgi:glycine/D-amino acid oxidase-like deaminating enzyme
LKSCIHYFIEDAAQRIRNRYPYMEQALSKGGWSGVYGVTPDWHPIIDEIPSGSGFLSPPDSAVTASSWVPRWA